MDLASVLLFAVALLIAAAIPGPSIAALIARVLTQGAGRNVGFTAGLVVGDMLWLAAAVYGLATLAAEAHQVIVVLKYLGAAYLIYLAYKMWTAPAAEPLPAAASGRKHLGSFAGGITMGLSNPKTMLFYPLVPNLIPLSEVGASTFAELLGVQAIVLAVVLGAYLYGASYARNFIASQRHMRMANRGSAVLMTGAAALVATRS
jgi:threonine/homoserine/homoserine lactone efflux protein